jgi:hypothetical protein
MKKNARRLHCTEGCTVHDNLDRKINPSNYFVCMICISSTVVGDRKSANSQPVGEGYHCPMFGIRIRVNSSNFYDDADTVSNSLR